jgi:hypothetical protein
MVSLSSLSARKAGAVDKQDTPAPKRRLLCQERTVCGSLCYEPATFVDADKGYPVCAMHALTPEDQEWLVGRMVEWHRQEELARARRLRERGPLGREFAALWRGPR